MVGKRLRTWVFTIWQPVVGYTAGSFALYFLYVYHIKRLLPGSSLSEHAFASNSLAAIKADPLNAPYKVIQLLVTKLDISPVIAARLTSLAFAIGLAWIFYYIISHWYSKRVALISSWLFCSSAWMLHIARIGNPSIIYCSILAFVGFGIWARENIHKSFAPVLGGLLVGVLLYVPGLVWFILGGLLWQFRTIRSLGKNSPKTFMIGLGIAILLAAPLVIKLALNTSLMPNWLGFTNGFNKAILLEFPQTIVSSMSQVIWRAEYNPELWLGRLPLLDFFSLMLSVLGIYNFSLDWKLDRSRIIFGMLSLCFVLIGLQALPLQAILPLCFILVASGIAFMIRQWFTVFPHNPFARSLAYVLLGTCVAAVTWYNFQHYFIAWPQTPATKTTFSRPL